LDLLLGNVLFKIIAVGPSVKVAPSLERLDFDLFVFLFIDETQATLLLA